MIRFSQVLILTLMLSSSIATGQWYEGGMPVQDREWRKSHKEFGAMMLLSSKPEEFLEAWDKSPSPDYGPKIETTETVSRGEPIVAFILFAGCRANEAGHCVSTTEFKVLKPDGTEYAALEPSELWTNKEPPPGKAVQLGLAYIGVVIEPEDPLGLYTVKANVCDQVADRCLMLTQRFTVTESVE
jgi:hypothetical protein